MIKYLEIACLIIAASNAVLYAITGNIGAAAGWFVATLCQLQVMVKENEK